MTSEYERLLAAVADEDVDGIDDALDPVLERIDTPETRVRLAGAVQPSARRNRPPTRALRPSNDNACMRRPQDWFRQAELDRAAARDAREHNHYEWACFAAHQAAEKAVKALHQASGVEAWGHSITALLGGLDAVPADVVEAAKSLDKHYIPARYPNAHPAGAPGDVYTDRDAARALDDLERVIDHVRSRLPPS